MKFDYLIIGAGSAGCVLANRLSENNQNNVAIFEAGKSSDIWKVNMFTFQISLDFPASNIATLFWLFSDNLLASTQPADPAPIIK